MLKSLITIHNYFRKGPAEVIRSQLYLNKNQKKPWAKDLVGKIKVHWQNNVEFCMQNPLLDKIRTKELSKLILEYAIFLEIKL